MAVWDSIPLGVNIANWQKSVISVEDTPPGSPVGGDRYLIGTGTGAWSGHDGDVTEYIASSWVFTDPIEGMIVWINSLNVFYLYYDSAWHSANWMVGPLSLEQGDVLYYTGSAYAVLHHGTSGQYLKTGGHGANPSWANVERIASVNIGDGNNVITTGLKAGFECPLTGTITAARIVSVDATSGAIAIGVWKDTYANAPPTVSDLIDTFSIAASGTKSEETGLSLAITKGDWIAFNVDSVTSMKLITLSLTLNGVF